MDQIKIGRFISSRRKEKNITQSELAEKLNITDRAISKWENGVCLPDANNMPELCKILDISINDLFSGEVVDMKENEKELPIFIKLLAYLWIPLLVLNVKVSETSVLSIDFRFLTGIFLVFLLPMVLFHEKKVYSINDACYVTTGVLFIGLSMSFFITYYNMNPSLLLYLLCITVFTDTFALFTGQLIGKNKLLEVISPKKTWEGFVGGTILGTFIAVMFYKTVINPEVILSNLILITLFLSIIGQLGDLFFSAIKRHYNKKDFSKWAYICRYLLQFYLESKETGIYSLV